MMLNRCLDERDTIPDGLFERVVGVGSSAFRCRRVPEKHLIIGVPDLDDRFMNRRGLRTLRRRRRARTVRQSNAIRFRAGAGASRASTADAPAQAPASAA